MINFIKENAGWVALVILAIVLGYGTLKTHTVTLGSSTACTDGYTCYTNLEVQGNQITDGTSLFSGAVSLTSTFKLGANGTAQSNEVIATCNPIANTSIAATSTGYIFCTGVTGVTSADNVIAQFATSTTAIGTNWAILGSNASTTAGAIDIKIMNLTGTAAVPSAAAGAAFASSTKIYASH